MAIGLWLPAAALWPDGAAAQSPAALTPGDVLPSGEPEGFASQIYAGSAQDSPYSEIYSHTLGTSGIAAEPSGPMSLLPPQPPKR